MNQGKAKKVKCGKTTRYLSSKPRCIMGCKTGQQLHKFPKDPIKKAEWFKILGISCKYKKNYLCAAHFPPNHAFGNRIYKHILPKPMEKLPPNATEIPTVSYQQNRTSTLDSSYTYDKQENQNSTVDDERESQTVNPEVYELRNPANGRQLLIGRYYQKDDFLMTIYTQTNNLTHQQQISLLNQKYEEQLKILKHLERENYHLTKALRRHQISFSQLRKIELKNVTIRKNIKKFKLKSKKLERRLKRQNIVKNKK